MFFFSLHLRSEKTIFPVSELGLWVKRLCANQARSHGGRALQFFCVQKKKKNSQ